jgi:hypothetical protein
MTHSAPARDARLRARAALIRGRDLYTPAVQRDAGFDRDAYDTLAKSSELDAMCQAAEAVRLPGP